ncbi:MAG: ABC transporter ATP-binding protein [Planctomycetes bacterium]|nr:ABC transporter ATP-binding protein [Planctomycetota bacterium]
MAEKASELVVNGVRKAFDAPGGRLEVLQGVDLRLEPGQAVAVTGPSGSGKSTLLYVIGTLEPPNEGTVQLNGQDPFELSEAERARFRNRHIGFVFQDHHLLPQCTVLENVLIPLLAGKGAGADDEARARQLLDRVGLGDRLSHRPAQLSGGERQRVAVCRALINQPTLVLADEPTGNLDRRNAEAIGTLLLELGREHNTMLICVTHSSELAERFPRRYQLRDGKLWNGAVQRSEKTEQKA